MCRDHAGECVVVLESWEARLDEIPGDGDWVVLLGVQAAAELRKDGCWYVRPVICRVLLASDGDALC